MVIKSYKGKFIVFLLWFIILSLTNNENIYFSMFVNYAFLFVLYKNELKEILNVKRWQVDWLIVFCSVILTIVLNSSLKLLFFEKIIYNTNTSQFLNYSVLLTIVSAVIFAPIFEEFIFRKLLRNIFNNTIYYVLFSSILFGLAHIRLDSGILPMIYSITTPFVFGFLSSIVYLKTSKLENSIIIHSLYNLIILIVALT